MNDGERMEVFTIYLSIYLTNYLSIYLSMFVGNIGLNDGERMEVFTTIAAVLHIGNIAFEVKIILF